MRIELNNKIITDSTNEYKKGIFFLLTSQNKKYYINQDFIAPYELLKNIKTKFIGITGTNGKTTTAFLIGYILKNLGFSVGVQGTEGFYLNEELNFSIFLRPPKFYKTESGKLILFAFFLLLLIVGDWIYRLYIINSQEKQIEKLRYEFSKKKKEYNLLKKEVKHYEEEIKKERKVIADLDKNLNDLISKVNFLYKIKVKGSLYNKLADIINFLTKHNLSYIKFEKHGKKYVIIIKSNFNNSKLIADFINYLISLHYKNVESKQILNNENFYITKVTYEDE
jgi:hypothetical protein